MTIHPITPRERVKTALNHQRPDRTPVDFLATPEIWDRLDILYFYDDVATQISLMIS
jgi:hypothetical protein